jgi:hypothetical protein
VPEGAAHGDVSGAATGFRRIGIGAGTCTISTQHQCWNSVSITEDRFVGKIGSRCSLLMKRCGANLGDLSQAHP